MKAIAALFGTFVAAVSAGAQPLREADRAKLLQTMDARAAHYGDL